MRKNCSVEPSRLGGVPGAPGRRSRAGRLHGRRRPGGSARDGGSIGVAVSAPPKTLDPALAAESDEPSCSGSSTRRFSPTGARTREGHPAGAWASGRPAEGLRRRPDLPALRCARGSPIRTARPCARATSSERSTGCALHSPLARLYDEIVTIEANPKTGAIAITLAQPDPSFPYHVSRSPARRCRAAHPSGPDRRPPRASGRTASRDPRRVCASADARLRPVRVVSPGHIDRINHLRPGRRPAGSGGHHGRLDVMQEPAPSRPAARDALEVPGPLPRGHDRLDRRGRAGHGRAAVRRPSRPARRRGVARPRRRSRGSTQACSSRAATWCRHGARLPPTRPCPIGDLDEPPDLPKAKQEIDDAGAAGAQ